MLTDFSSTFSLTQNEKLMPFTDDATFETDAMRQAFCSMSTVDVWIWFRLWQPAVAWSLGTRCAVCPELCWTAGHVCTRRRTLSHLLCSRICAGNSGQLPWHRYSRETQHQEQSSTVRQERWRGQLCWPSSCRVLAVMFLQWITFCCIMMFAYFSLLYKVCITDF